MRLFWSAVSNSWYFKRPHGFSKRKRSFFLFSFSIPFFLYVNDQAYHEHQFFSCKNGLEFFLVLEVLSGKTDPQEADIFDQKDLYFLVKATRLAKIFDKILKYSVPFVCFVFTMFPLAINNASTLTSTQWTSLLFNTLAFMAWGTNISGILTVIVMTVMILSFYVRRLISKFDSMLISMLESLNSNQKTTNWRDVMKLMNSLNSIATIVKSFDTYWCNVSPTFLIFDGFVIAFLIDNAFYSELSGIHIALIIYGLIAFLFLFLSYFGFSAMINERFKITLRLANQLIASNANLLNKNETSGNRAYRTMVLLKVIVSTGMI